MPCTKPLTISGACELTDCVTADQFPLPGTDYMYEYSMGFAPDLCYAMAATHNNPADTETVFNKYDPDTNTLIEKATHPGLIPGQFTYDEKHRLFVCAAGATVILYDPLTETLDTFATGITGTITALFYVPEKELTYGHIGEDGLGQHYVGYLDLDLRIAVQLGVIPAVGGSNPFGYNLVYSPIADAIYGAWQTGVSQGLLKFDLDTNTGSLIIGAVTGIECCWDSDQNYLVVCGATINEWDTDIDALARATPCPAGYDLRWMPFYVSSLTKVVAAGFEYPSGDLVIASFNTDTAGFVKELEDFQYYGIRQVSEGSFLSSAFNDGTSQDGIRRICIT